MKKDLIKELEDFIKMIKEERSTTLLLSGKLHYIRELGGAYIIKKELKKRKKWRTSTTG